MMAWAFCLPSLGKLADLESFTVSKMDGYRYNGRLVDFDQEAYRTSDTSKNDGTTHQYGRHGVFLASLASLSLTTITSHHHLHRSHNGLVLHHSNVVARRTPAPPHQHVSLGAHGTRVVVKDLFGNMPVRVKHLALANERRIASLKEWKALNEGVVGLLLAWGRQVRFMARDTEYDKKLVLRWPGLTDQRSRHENLLNQTPATSAAISNCVISQAFGLPPQRSGYWVELSASSSLLLLKGAISLVPAPTKRYQFLAFSIHPIWTASENGFLFDDVNALFGNSAFGTTDELAACKTDLLRKRNHGGEDDFKPRPATLSKSRLKAVDRWPIFFIRISLDPSKANDSLVVDQMHSSSGLTLAIRDLLRATIRQFLRNHDFDLGRSNQTSNGDALGSTLDPSPRQGGASSKEDSFRQLLPGKGQSKSWFTLTGPAARPEKTKTGNQDDIPDKRRSQPSAFPIDDLGGGVLLPIFGKEFGAKDGADFTNCGRMKSSKPYHDGRLANKSAKLRDKRAAEGNLSVEGLAVTVDSSARPRPGASTRETKTVEVRHLSSNPTSEKKALSSDFARSKALVDLTKATSLPQGSLTPNFEEVTAINPSTRVPFQLSTRTGNAIPPKISVASPVFSANDPLQTLAGSQSTHWLQEVIAHWENPIFRPAEQPVPKLSLDFAVLDAVTLDLSTAYPGISFPLGVSTKDGSQLRRYRFAREALRQCKVISQFAGKFLLVKLVGRRDGTIPTGSDAEKEILVAIDQHAADERCRIEKLLSEICTVTSDHDESRSALSSLGLRSRIKTVVLDKTIVIEIDERDCGLYQTHAPYFARWGILYDLSLAQNGGMWNCVVKTIPPGIAERCNVEPQLLIDLLRKEIWRREDLSVAQSSDRSTPDLDASSTDDGYKWVEQLSDCPQTMLDLLNSRACRSQSDL